MAKRQSEETTQKVPGCRAWVSKTTTTLFFYLDTPISIPMTEIDSTLCGLTTLNCIPQPGTAVGLDPLREVVMWRLQYRNFGTHEAIFGNSSVAAIELPAQADKLVY